APPPPSAATITRREFVKPATSSPAQKEFGAP
ncbi:MAG: hypothetical protein JWN36_2256, partial [Microbacteriaceae bacterium]|nr:hypothetical protein [Microbacteriaceae bacterium]